jgi:hypothetical protein
VDQVTRTSKQATWEQILELHAALCHVILHNRHNSERWTVLQSLQQAASTWALCNGLN